MSRLTAVALALMASSPAYACAVCFSGSDHSRWAYLGTTIFLSLLPLMLIGSVVFWLYRLAKAQAAPQG